jgi:hypothetical protein
MGKEIKKETGWLGGEKWVIYEDGIKVGETRRETGLFGDEKQVTYDTNGQKVSETKRETGWFGDEKFVTYDTRGQKLSETRYEKDWLGTSKEVIYEKGEKIGELEKGEGIWDTLSGTRKKVLREKSGHDVDLTRRAPRERPKP